jgi:hypothetical protein
VRSTNGQRLFRTPNHRRGVIPVPNPLVQIHHPGAELVQIQMLSTVNRVLGSTVAAHLLAAFGPSHVVSATTMTANASDDPVGELVSKAKGYAGLFKCNTQNSLGFRDRH